MIAAALGLAAVPATGASPLSEFAKPHRLVDIGGRKLNLFCTGTGKRTVVLEAGGSDWSAIWGLVQPALESDARVCSYDRAGLGYSDPAPTARSPIAIVTDLNKLVHDGGIDTPFVLVGHSLGGFNAKLYAALYPQDVAGLVLVDPAEERSEARAHSYLLSLAGPRLTAKIELSDRQFLDFLVSRYRDCVERAKSGLLATDAKAYRSCTDPVRDPLGPDVAAERARLQPLVAYQSAQYSELANSVYGDEGSDAAYKSLFRPGLFGKLPLIVLTHGNHDASDPEDDASFKTGVLLHRQTARLSTRGEHRLVEHSDHNIEIDQPQAIITAVKDVLAAIH